MSVKPLFIPLVAKFYDDFLAGRKDTEYRLHGPRWNSKTCYPERQAILSRGYGKQNRAGAVISKVEIIELVEFEPAFQDRLRALMNIEHVHNPEIIAVKMKDVHRVFYQDRIYMGVDMGRPGGDRTVETTYRLDPEKGIEIIKMEEK